MYQPYGLKTTLDSFSLEDQAKDLERITSKFRGDGYRRISLVSHSMGVFTLLLSKLDNVEKMVWWEPSLHPKEMFKYAKRDKWFYYFSMGYTVQVKRSTIRKMEKTPAIDQLIEAVEIPVKVITAERAGKEIGKEYYKKIKSEKAIKMIKDADHNFSSVDMEQQLYRETLRWLKK